MPYDMNKQIREILSCTNLGKTFSNNQLSLEILREIELSIAERELIAIVGASGSGKSTLLHLLAGLEIPSTGSVIVDGQDLNACSQRDKRVLRNRSFGFVYQFHHLLAEFTAKENVAMPLLIARHSYKEALIKAQGLLKIVGLEGRYNHKPSELSGGERQRAAIARAIINNPRCLFADEPTGNLDERTAMDVQSLLVDLNQKNGMAMIFATHDHMLARRADRMFELRAGMLWPIIS